MLHSFHTLLGFKILHLQITKNGEDYDLNYSVNLELPNKILKNINKILKRNISIKAYGQINISTDSNDNVNFEIVKTEDFQIKTILNKKIASGLER